MGKKTILLDDFDGKELPDTTDPLTLHVGPEGWNLYLSEASHKKLMQALEPFVKDAESASKYSITVTKGRRSSKPKSDLDLGAVRKWAQENKKTFTNAQGKETPVGDRGRIPDSIIDAYKEAHAA